jgi:uncharacterized protein YdaU (DUF1376 family)
MHYYPHHIGDYRSGTMHLSNEEDLAYRRLLEMYYDTEQPIPLETQWVARRLRVDTQALDSVLKDYFQRTEDGWRNPKCDLVIREYHEMADKNRRNGMKGGRPKTSKHAVENPVGSQSDASRMPVATHWKANQEPITNNQKPKPHKKAPAVLCPAGVEPNVWSDWLEIRKAKNLPLTETAWSQLMVECEKSGLTVDAMIKECCLRGWGAFKAAWWEKEAKEVKGSFKTQGDRNAEVIRGLTRGLLGSGKNVKLLGN